MSSRPFYACAPVYLPRLTVPWASTHTTSAVAPPRAASCNEVRVRMARPQAPTTATGPLRGQGMSAGNKKLLNSLATRAALHIYLAVTSTFPYHNLPLLAPALQLVPSCSFYLKGWGFRSCAACTGPRRSSSLFPPTLLRLHALGRPAAGCFVCLLPWSCLRVWGVGVGSLGGLEFSCCVGLGRGSVGGEFACVGESFRHPERTRH